MRGARSISEQGRELEREGQERKVQEEEEEQEPRLTKMVNKNESNINDLIFLVIPVSSSSARQRLHLRPHAGRRKRGGGGAVLTVFVCRKELVLLAEKITCGDIRRK